MSILKVQELQHTNGTSAMTIDTAGRVNRPNKCFFHVYIDSSGGNPGTGGTSDRVPFTAALHNEGNHFTLDATNPRFTAPIAGVYQFNWLLNLYNVTAGNWVRQRVYINGGGTNQDFILAYLDYPTTDDQSLQSSFALKLNANDYVEFICNSQVSATYSAGSTWNSATGYLVG